VTDCVFCSIARGEAPAESVYEDDQVIAIMDDRPATRGHVLVMPRTHSEDLSTVGEDDAKRVMGAAVKAARLIQAALGPDGVNLFVASGRAAWQKVFHFHLHVVPRYASDPLVPPWSPDQPRADPSELAELAERIRGAGTT
jgi:histidine triad (HIT) family protein